MQETLFNPLDLHPVPTNGTETSGLAAVKAKRNAASDAAMILEWIKSRGIFGATADETDEHFNLGHATTSARISGLAKQGLIRDSGLKRNTRKGCKAMVYVRA